MTSLTNHSKRADGPLLKTFKVIDHRKEEVGPCNTLINEILSCKEIIFIRVLKRAFNEVTYVRLITIGDTLIIFEFLEIKA